MRSKRIGRLAWLVIPLLVAGCGGSSDGPAEIEYLTAGAECPPGLGTLPSACCSAQCPGAGTTITTGALVGGARSLASASESNDMASNLVGSENVATDGTSAAVEGVSRGGLATSAEGIAGGATAGGRRGGSGGGAGAGVYGPGVGGSLSTAAAELPTKIDESKLTKADKESLYGAGAGGPAGGDSNPFRGLASMLGGGGEGGLSPGAAEASFGGDGGVNPRGSLDPENYFALGGDMTLFRRVSIAHERKSQGWALQKAQQLKQ